MATKSSPMTQLDRVKHLVNVPGTFPSETVKPTAPLDTGKCFANPRTLRKLEGAS